MPPSSIPKTTSRWHPYPRHTLPATRPAPRRATAPRKTTECARRLILASEKSNSLTQAFLLFLIYAGLATISYIFGFLPPTINTIFTWVVAKPTMATVDSVWPIILEMPGTFEPPPESPVKPILPAQTPLDLIVIPQPPAEPTQLSLVLFNAKPTLTPSEGPSQSSEVQICPTFTSVHQKVGVFKSSMTVKQRRLRAQKMAGLMDPTVNTKSIVHGSSADAEESGNGQPAKPNKSIDESLADTKGVVGSLVDTKENSTGMIYRSTEDANLFRFQFAIFYTLNLIVGILRWNLEEALVWRQASQVMSRPGLHPRTPAQLNFFCLILAQLRASSLEKRESGPSHIPISVWSADDARESISDATARGWGPQRTSGTGNLCGAFALIQAMRNVARKVLPTLDELREHFRDNIDDTQRAMLQLPDPSVKGASRRTYISDDNLLADQLAVVARLYDYGLIAIQWVEEGARATRISEAGDQGDLIIYHGGNYHWESVGSSPRRRLSCMRDLKDEAANFPQPRLKDESVESKSLVKKGSHPDSKKDRMPKLGDTEADLNRSSQNRQLEKRDGKLELGDKDPNLKHSYKDSQSGEKSSSVGGSCSCFNGPHRLNPKTSFISAFQMANANPILSKLATKVPTEKCDASRSTEEEQMEHKKSLLSFGLAKLNQESERTAPMVCLKVLQPYARLADTPGLASNSTKSVTGPRAEHTRPKHHLETHLLKTTQNHEKPQSIRRTKSGYTACLNALKSAKCDEPIALELDMPYDPSTESKDCLDSESVCTDTALTNSLGDEDQESSSPSPLPVTSPSPIPMHPSFPPRFVSKQGTLLSPIKEKDETKSAATDAHSSPPLRTSKAPRRSRHTYGSLTRSAWTTPPPASPPHVTSTIPPTTDPFPRSSAPTPYSRPPAPDPFLHSPTLSRQSRPDTSPPQPHPSRKSSTTALRKLSSEIKLGSTKLQRTVIDKMKDVNRYARRAFSLPERETKAPGDGDGADGRRRVFSSPAVRRRGGK